MTQDNSLGDELEPGDEEVAGPLDRLERWSEDRNFRKEGRVGSRFLYRDYSIGGEIAKSSLGEEFELDGRSDALVETEFNVNTGRSLNTVTVRVYDNRVEVYADQPLDDKILESTGTGDVELLELDRENYGPA